MIRKIILSTAALVLSTSVLAEWKLNVNDVPVVMEENSPSKVLALYACPPNSEHPQLVLGDEKIPDSAVGKNLTFKARVDRGPIYDITAAIYHLGGSLNGVYIDMMGEATIRELMDGNYIRFQFKTDTGQSIVETYSLKGFTRMFTRAALECANNQGEEFFEQGTTPQTKDGEYFL